MNKLKAGLVGVVGLAVGVVTLRAVGKRRATPEDEAETAVEETLQGTTVAADRAVAAAEHARVAGEEAIEYAREEVEAVNDEDLPKPVRRLRKVGRGWIRR